MKQKEVKKPFLFCIKEAHIPHVPMFPTPLPSWDPDLFSIPESCEAKLLFYLITSHHGTLAKHIF